MNLSEAVSVGALAVAALALLRGFLTGAGDRAKEVTSLDGRVSALEREAKDMNAALQQVQRDVALVPQLNAKLDGLDRLVMFRMDELGQQVRQIALTVAAPVVIPGPETRRGHAGQNPPVQQRR